MGDIDLWDAINERIGLKMDDKVLVGNSDTGEAEYITLAELKQIVDN